MYVKNLSFRHHKQASYFFKDLSFALEEGKMHALHGKNGVGKSVLLHILSGQIEKGNLLTGDISGQRALLMSQQFDQTLAGQFTFLQNLQFGLFSRFPSPFARFKSSPIKKPFDELLTRFHIDVNLPVHQLSGGQRQILALLMQLQKKPQILLLDEPTATLDEQNAMMVFEFLKELKGVTMLVVCHDQELIKRYATGSHFQLEMSLDGSRHLKELL